MNSKSLIAAAAVAMLALAPSFALAGPEGTYDMTGTNPGDRSPYKGIVEVEKTGETYAVTWRFGADETHGIGTLTSSENVFAVSYGSGKSHGIALYELQGDGAWSGTWSTIGGKALGTEIWNPQGGGKTRAGNAGATPASGATPDGTSAARR